MKQKTNLLFLVMLIMVLFSISELFSNEQNPKNKLPPAAGFCSQLQMGYNKIESADLKNLNTQNQGSIEQSSISTLLSLGATIVFPESFQASILSSYLGGGNYLWSFDDGSQINMMVNMVSVHTELQPLLPVFNGFLPFLGGGYSFINNVVDTNGDGFTSKGLFLIGGLDIFNSFGFKPEILLRTPDDTIYFGFRASFVYHLPYNYSFGIEGMSSSLSDSTYQASSWSLCFGITMGFCPWDIGEKPNKKYEKKLPSLP